MGEISKKSFEVVKDFVTKQYPEFGDIILKVCEDAEEIYQESKVDMAAEGKKPRVFAHTLHEDGVVCYTERMDTEISGENRIGIFLHEFGHLYVDSFPEDVTDEEFEAMDEDTVEVMADLAVKEFFGVEIKYDNNDIQFVNLPLVRKT